MKGIDVYSDTNIIDWQKIKQEVDAVYIKATEGLNYDNPRLDEFYNAAKNVGLLVGFYHFAGKNNSVDEYKHFSNTISKYKADLKPVLDYETEPVDFGFINSFMAQSNDLLLYSYHEIADRSGFPIQKQWIAEPNTNPTDTKGYAGIQTSWEGKINGIDGNTDVDLFSNTILFNVSNYSDNRVKQLQTDLNSLFNANLVIDGISGPCTETAKAQAKTYFAVDSDEDMLAAIREVQSHPFTQRGSNNTYAVRWIQWRVGTSIDGIFGYETLAKVQDFQSNCSLVPDGIVGNLTWTEMFK